MAGHPVQHVAGREEQVFRRPAGLDLVPGDRRGDGGTRPGPQRVGSHGGLGPVVLAPVDEDLAGAQRLGHPRHREPGLIAFQPLGERLGLLAGLFGGYAGDRGVQLQALPAGGLGQRGETRGSEQRPQRLGHPAAVDDVRGLPRVEVEDQQVGAADVGHPPHRDVQLQAGQVGRPDERGQVVHHQVGDHGAAGPGTGRVDPGGADPVGPVLGDVLVEEGLAVDAVGVTLEGQRAARQVRQRRGRHPLVIVEHLGLGEPGRRVQHLGQVSQRQRPPVDLDGHLGLRAHGPRPRDRCHRAAPGRPAPASGPPWSTCRSPPG